MSISYNPLWEMLEELDITKMDFARMIDISNATLAKLGKNEPITLTTVDKICNRFNCSIENIVKHIPEITYNKANFMIEKGMIVLADDCSRPLLIKIENKESPLYKTNELPHVVLDIISPDGDNDPIKIQEASFDDLSYLIAPIYTQQFGSYLLDLRCNDLEIGGKASPCTISISKASVVTSGLLHKKLGMLPEKYIDKINKILLSLESALNVLDEESE